MNAVNERDGKMMYLTSHLRQRKCFWNKKHYIGQNQLNVNKGVREKHFRTFRDWNNGNNTLLNCVIPSESMDIKGFHFNCTCSRHAEILTTTTGKCCDSVHIPLLFCMSLTYIILWLSFTIELTINFHWITYYIAHVQLTCLCIII